MKFSPISEVSNRSYSSKFQLDSYQFHSILIWYWVDMSMILRSVDDERFAFLSSDQIFEEFIADLYNIC
jgi:hypothetical protein